MMQSVFLPGELKKLDKNTKNHIAFLTPDSTTLHKKKSIVRELQQSRGLPIRMNLKRDIGY